MRLHSSRHHRPARAGFTLVELLVALALSVFIMAILSEAFVKGLEVFSQYKVLSDLENRLRTTANLLRRDLRAPHFEGNKKLSECTFSGRPMPRLDGLRAGIYDSTNAVDQQAVATLMRELAPYRFTPPKLGFFSVEEWPNRPAPAGGTPRETMFFEGADPLGRPSYRDIYDVLHFTARLEGNEPDKFFYCKVRPGSPLDGVGLLGGSTRYDSAGNSLFSTQMAELLYFVSDDETANIPGVISRSDQVGPGPMRTFNLHRQALGLVPDRFSNGQTAAGDDAYTGNPPEYWRQNDVSALFNPNDQIYYYNSMADVQHRLRRRLAGQIRQRKQIPGTTQMDGSDILLTNVLSFDVKVWDPFAYKLPLTPASGRGAFVDIGDVQQTNAPKMAESDPVPAGGFGPNPFPTAAGVPNDLLTPVYGATLNTYAIPDTTRPGFPAVVLPEFFDTGTSRTESLPGDASLTPPASPPTHAYPAPSTHAFPFSTIQITIRVWDPTSRQTRQITIIQDM